MAIVALFTLGSGICGGASNGAMLIAGRAIQGMGSGGINMIVDIIVSDLVPLRERGNYMAMGAHCLLCWHVTWSVCRRCNC